MRKALTPWTLENLKANTERNLSCCLFHQVSLFYIMMPKGQSSTGEICCWKRKLFFPPWLKKMNDLGLELLVRETKARLMNFPNLLKFPKVCTGELAKALSVIAQLYYVVCFSFLFHVWPWWINSGSRTRFCSFMGRDLDSATISVPRPACVACAGTEVALGQLAQSASPSRAPSPGGTSSSPGRRVGALAAPTERGETFAVVNLAWCWSLLLSSKW